jgi:hypothetical protein
VIKVGEGGRVEDSRDGVIEEVEVLEKIVNSTSGGLSASGDDSFDSVSQKSKVGRRLRLFSR